PTSGNTGLDADAPRGAAVLDDLIRQCGQLLEGGGDLVALVGERLGAVPHQRLDVGTCRHAVDLAVDGGELWPTGDVVSRDGFRQIIREREQLVLLDEIKE